MDPSLPSTPSEEPLHFTPKRAMASFDNLVALANHQERLREARKIIWRDRGEPVVELGGLKECLEHAVKGGSGALAFNIRAAVNMVLALIRIRSVPSKHRFALVRHALLGQDTWRFAAMLGTFTSLYNPSSSPSSSPPSHELPLHQKGRLSARAQAQLLLVRKKTRRWHATLAGAIAGGLAIMWEKRSRRGIISQQMFVRGLQGSYNAYSSRHGIHVPYGDVLVFSLACGQIMYAFLMRPDTLPRSYTSWISQASKVPPQAVKMNMNLVRDHKLDMADLDTLMARPDIKPNHKSALQSLRDLTLSLTSPPTSPLVPSPTGKGTEYYPLYGPCAAVHPAVASCAAVPMDRFWAVFKWMLPIYGALHFVPAVVFRWKRFLQDPMKVVLKASGGSLRSSAFLGVYVVIYQSADILLQTCFTPAPFPHLPISLTNILITKPSFLILGLFAGLSLLIEEPRRRPELAMYVLPKGLESLWVMLRGKGWGDVWLTAVGMGMVMDTYQNDPKVLGGLVRRVLYQFVGPN
ncbi:hypothetical protein BDQ17DRAFT_1360047 [Cyathus striatus]|nr:hypothetical protein BDQ17DRAFT_1360047 [Cyathus striatus]